MKKKLHFCYYAGQRFLTTKGTILNEPNSIMSQMLNGEMARIVKDDEGAIMIDRSPKYFEPILNYLRTGEILIDSDVNKEAVLAEAKYFGIQSFVDQYEKNDVTWPPINFEVYQVGMVQVNPPLGSGFLILLGWVC